MKVLTPSVVGPEVLDEPCSVIVHISTRCGVCHLVTPWLERIAEIFGEKVKVVQVTAYKDERPMRYVRGVKELTGFPFTSIYKNGKPVYHFYGFRNENDYIRKVMYFINEGIAQ